MSILIVDDSADMRTSLKSLLRMVGYAEVETAASPLEAFAKLGLGAVGPSAVPVDVILMDIMMPEMDGLEACRRLKADPRLCDIPIIIVTGRTEEKDLEAAFAAGAIDYVTKPVKIAELLARLRSALTLKAELDLRKAHEAELLDLTRRLQEANQVLERLSNLDGLTGVANRRCFETLLADEWARAMRQEAALSLLMIDLDHFKGYNDFYGHQQGDECLRQIAQALGSILKRPGDTVARYGGEEFGVLLPNTSEDGARAVAEALRAKVECLQLPHACNSVGQRVTISVGVATLIPPRYSLPQTLVALADQALYEAKHAGRNCSRVGHNHREDSLAVLSAAHASETVHD